MSRVRRLLVTLVAVAVASPLLGSCSHSTPTPTESPSAALAAAKHDLDRADGFRVTLDTKNLPHGVNGVIKADGVGTHAPAFTGTIEVAINGFAATVPVVATGGKVYAKLPLTTHWVTIDPSTYGAPDPARLMSTSDGLSSLLTAAQHPTKGSEVRQGKEVLTTYKATLPGSAVQNVIPSADPTATYQATFTIGPDHRLSEAQITGPFYGKGADVTYTITFSDYGTHPTITAPSAS